MVDLKDLSQQQIDEIKSIIFKMKKLDEKDGYKTNYIFSNKYSTEEMMMRVAMSFNN